jgi:hypothetical protein
MATAEEYAQWIVQHPDKKGTPEFETVVKAYRAKRAEQPSQEAPSAPAAKAPEPMGFWEKAGYAAVGVGKEVLTQAEQLGARGMIAAQPFKQEDLDKAGEYIKHPGQAFGNIASGIGNAASSATDLVTGLLHPGDTPEELEKFGRRGVQAAEVVASAAKGIASLVGSAGKTAAEALPQVVREHEPAAAAAGLPKSEGLHTPAGQDLESHVRSTADQKLKDLVEARNEKAGPLWDKYRERAAGLEKRNAFFSVSDAGRDLLDDLTKIETGGTGKMTEYTAEMRKDATTLREALSGMDPERPAHRPVSLDVVDTELRKLRAKQYNVGPNGYDAVTRAKYGKLADKLEAALERWVGEDVYPRKQYAEASKEINKWGSKLGQKLAGRQDLEYTTADQSPEAYQGKVSNEVFKSPTTIKEARTLLGDAAVKQMADRFVSNNLRYRSSESAVQWYEKNPWIKDYPDLQHKTERYLAVLATRERNTAVLRRLKQIGVGAAATAAVAGTGAEVFKAVSGQ